MYDIISYQMINLCIKEVKNEEIKKGLKIALEIMSNSSYYDLNDWENLTEKEQIEEIKEYIK